MMSYEKLKVYQLSLDCVEQGFTLLEGPVKGYTDLCSQLQRAIVSVALNIAEGAGKSGLPDKRRYYGIAEGSAMESAAVSDILYRAKVIDHKNHANCRALLEQVICMLTRMCINLENNIGKERKRKS
jgi:four helix bundle protein